MGVDSAQQIRGYCWFVRPEAQNTTGVQPFPRSDSRGADPTAETIRPPADVEGCWALSSNTFGIKNKITPRTFLVVTTTEAPPTIEPGWVAEPAVLDDEFQLDRRGSQWVHLLRLAGEVDSPQGRLQLAEFESGSM